eukprot:TRINITY_DN12288_c0_g1_i1.p1 TRINITY_DN12288_c0_g1~~TRINITY_DN12288_c0_g1_i1.p1  ORF type:complete len:390 (-),score=34.36 TRINITY_DN12288_c0_g1_i1:110-1279(-)
MLYLFTVFLLISAIPAFSQTFNLVDFGAVGDGVTNDTNAMLEAIQEVKKAGSGTVYVPEGVYLIWPFELTSNMILYLERDAVLLAPSFENWPMGTLYYVLGDNIHNISILGGGIIDGQGAPWWPYYKNPAIQQYRPILLEILESKDILVRDITLTNSPKYHFIPKTCHNVEVINVTILAPPYPISHNTDGIDPWRSHNVTIRDCFISTGDDNVAVRANSSHILVENCYFGYGHGASVGSLDDGEYVHNVTFRNIVFVNTTNGARIKIVKNSTLTMAEEIVYQNLTMHNVLNSLMIDCDYTRTTPSGKNVDEAEDGNPVVDNVLFENIVSTNTTSPVNFNCNSKMTCKNIQMIDINMSSDNFYCHDASGTQENVTPDYPCLQHQSNGDPI